jgi:peptidoglycan/xylan/chitin deacetylase (PgdA/CDA1 family)
MNVGHGGFDHRLGGTAMKGRGRMRPHRRGRSDGPLALLLALAMAVGLLALPPQASTAAPSCSAGYAALTFDDGPSNTNTPKVLDLLAQQGVHATFFVLGSRVDSHPATVRRTGAEGHALANHTYRHDRLPRLTDTQIVSTVDATHRAIRRAGAEPLPLVRPPYGETSQRVRDALSRAGYAHITWTLDPRDWEATATQIAQRVLSQIRHGSVVLLHDGVSNTPQTLAALPRIIDGAHRQGLCFTTLDARGRLVPPGPPPDPGPFADVAASDTHAPAIARLKEAGIVTGCAPDLYCPTAPVTRAQMATLLARTLDLPAGSTAPFDDVTSSHPHAAGIGSVAAAGITRGCVEGAFCPSDAVRRDQMATFLARGFDLEPHPDQVFVDVPASSVHAPAVGAVAEAGVARGCSSDGPSYCPGATVTRAQMASFLARALDLDDG